MENVVAEMIREHKKGSWQWMENAVGSANKFRLDRRRSNQDAGGKKNNGKATGKPLKITIDRRKLQQLAEGNTSIPLTMYELELLDTFFVREGRPGLAEVSIFRRHEDLFRLVSGAQRVSFFVGGRSVAELGEMIARWDVSALNAMRNRLSNTTATEAFDVASRNTGLPLKIKEWQILRGQVTGSVQIGIGSPIASACSEYLMSLMFDIPAYRAQANLPPVCFLHANSDYASAFVRDPLEIDGMSNETAALIVNGQSYVSKPTGIEFGVVVGQRTGPDNALFVVAGNSGPGTMASAEFFAAGQIGSTLPRYTGKGRQPVLVAIISTDIGTVVTDRRIDKRTVANTKLVGKPMLFEHVKGKWEETSLIGE